MGVTVMAGESLGHTSRIETRTPCTFLHVKLWKKGTTFRQLLPEKYTAFLYTLENCHLRIHGGDGQHADAEAHHTVVLEKGDGKSGVEIEALRNASEFVLMAAMPLGEPVVQHGPFVMSSEAEIRQTIEDFQRGRNGFESAPGWRSENRTRMPRSRR